MKDFIKNNWKEILTSILITNAIAYGLSDYIEYTKTLALFSPFVAIIIHFLDRKTGGEVKTDEIIKDLDSIIGEQSQVIEEYEKIFDSQLVELPCVCGGNTFQGLFSPKTENVVECEKCHNKYKVNINYDSVMISEPLNLDKTFNELVGEV